MISHRLETEVEFSGSDMPHPVPYSFLYLQWDANRVRNLSFVHKKYL